MTRYDGERRFMFMPADGGMALGRGLNAALWAWRTTRRPVIPGDGELIEWDLELNRTPQADLEVDRTKPLTIGLPITCEDALRVERDKTWTVER